MTESSSPRRVATRSVVMAAMALPGVWAGTAHAESAPEKGLIGLKYLRYQDEQSNLKRITVDPATFGGKPIVRGRRLAVEHVLGMLAAGDSTETILAGYPWLEADDVRACLVYARRLVGHERVDPPLGDAAA